jgi:hypothetical protein
MTRRRKTDGERIILALRKDGWMRLWLPDGAAYIDRLIRKRMGEAWAEGHEYGAIYDPDLDANPYRGRTKK